MNSREGRPLHLQNTMTKLPPKKRPMMDCRLQKDKIPVIVDAMQMEMICGTEVRGGRSGAIVTQITTLYNCAEKKRISE